LRNFAIDDNVWVVDLHEEKSYQSTIKNILCISDFYTVSTVEQEDVVEQFLSSIESRAKSVIDSIRNKMQIPKGSDRETLNQFLASLHLRGPHMRQGVLEIFESTLQWSKDFMVSDTNLLTPMIEKAEEYGLTKKQAQEILRDCKVEAKPPREYYISLFMDMLPRISLILGKMSMRIFIIPPSSNYRFITCDHPFAMEYSTPNPIPQYGRAFADKDLFIFVPISPLTCLVLGYDLEPGVVPALHGRSIAGINASMIIATSRYVISHSKNFAWLKPDHTISRSMHELFELISDDKRNKPHIKTGSKVIPHSDWNLLKGKPANT
jgi:hypothetical protein